MPFTHYQALTIYRCVLELPHCQWLWVVLRVQLCFGTPDKRATYICCMHKARVLANVYYWRRKGVEYAMDCPEEFAVPLIGEEEYQRLCSMCSKGGV